ncbi:hypothetical protein ACNF42_08205 [Cuniculiplasma sp. SKW3]|uniref:hypothetical protein n=1 Tax=Cuniculiplasma sp. SKW3 TaxID=3400170 RepID=UPI003FD4258F
MEEDIEPFIMSHNDREFRSQPFYVDYNMRVDKTVDSFLYLPGIQSSFGRENNMFNLEVEDIDDPEYLSEIELIQIEASLKDYSEGRFKRGSIDDLLKDLND